MVDETTSFKKKGKGKKKVNFKKNSKQVAAQEKKPKSGPKPECFYCKQTGHWKRNCPKYLADKKDGEVNKGICDIHVIDVYLLVFIATPQYLILVQLLRVVTPNRSYRMNRK